MIALGASQALEGVSTDASETTYTISGCLLTNGAPPAPSVYQVLAQGQLASSAASIYNPGASNYALISSIHLFNNNTVSETVTLSLEGTAAANKICTLQIPAGGFANYESGAGWQVYTSSGAQIRQGGLNNVSSYISSTVTLTATTIVNVTSVSLPPGTWLILGSMYSRLTTATLGHCDAWLGPTTASKTGAYTSASFSMGDIAGGTEDGTATLVTVQTLASTATVYLEAYASEASTAENISDEQSIANCTGILAIQIG